MTNYLQGIHITPKTGLVHCDKPETAACFSEHFHIQEKAIRLEADAVFFRREYNENNEIVRSKPTLYIFHREYSFINNNEHKRLHAKIWSAGDIDAYFVLSQTRIEIFNARKQAKINNENELELTELRLAAEALKSFDDQRFSAMVFGKGIFWEQSDFYNKKQKSFFDNKLKEENTPFHQLLEYLMAVRSELTKTAPLLSETIDKILGSFRQSGETCHSLFTGMAVLLG
ncbi:MAG: hypothetical protein GY862_02495 [Gammaproteobacteria bacterium]|nr:hypothetical protein [Gammaproteobacteria bacterium]